MRSAPVEVRVESGAGFVPLDAEGRRLGVGFDHPSAPERLAGHLETLHRRFSRRVAVLVHEYDKPILDMLDSPEIARANRDLLRDTYGILKAAEDHLRFVFLTGVSKFSKVSLFSGLNNLLDITMDPAHSAICGYADADLDTVFESELAGLDRERIRDWYNGYNWLGDEVYNPFDILLLFRRRKFGAYWFETRTPTFLLDTLLKRRVSSVELDGLIAGESLLSAFDVDDISPEALLIFEFKVVEMEPDGAAMAQLREKDYAAKYRGGAGEVYLVGVEFSRKTRNVVGFEVGRA